MRSWIDLFSKETQNPLSDSLGFKKPILEFFKETHNLFNLAPKMGHSLFNRCRQVEQNLLSLVKLNPCRILELSI